MQIHMVAAIGQNRELGKDNQLLWHLPEDFRRFKELTKGKTVVMGEKTLLSLPPNFRPLPGRRTLVLTLDTNFTHKDCEIFHDKQELLNKMKDENLSDLWILGGAQMYKLFLPEADKLHLTLVEEDFEADTFFPEYNSIFSEIESQSYARDEKNSHPMRFTTWERKNV